MTNATLDQLTARGPVQSGDLVPILPVGATVLQNETAAALRTFMLAGSGAQSGLVVLAPSGDTTGATDTAAIQAALNTGADVYLAPGVYYTNATLTITTVAQHGQRLYGAGPTSTTGLGALATIIRPTAAVTTAIKIDGTPFSGFVQSFRVDALTIDMVNMADLSTSVAINQVQAFDLSYDRIRVINYGTAKVSWLFSTGAYVSVLTACAGGLVRFSGTALSNATTTITLNGCDFTWIDDNFAVGVALNGGTIQRPYDATVPIIYLAAGTTPYGYSPNVAGLYCAVMSKIDNSRNFSSIGCDWEQDGGYPATYNDGTHGVLTLIRVVQVTALATNTLFINPQFAGCYLLDAGINTRVLGYQTVGIDLCTGKDYHFGDLPTSGNIVGFTNFTSYLGGGTTVTYTINAALGSGAFQTFAIRPAADADQVFTIKNAAGSFLLDFNTSANQFSLANGVGLTCYSDTLSTQTFSVNGATGLVIASNAGVEGVRLTPSGGTVTLKAGGGIFIGGVNVLQPRKTGWGVASGTLSRAAYTAYAGQTYTGTYTQATEQATDNAVKLLSQTVAALISDLTSHGLIGP